MLTCPNPASHQSASIAKRKPMLPVELSGVDAVRAATRYRLQYDAWHRYDPPLVTLASPDGGPLGSSIPPRG